jgi:hypothetical protein
MLATRLLLSNDDNHKAKPPVAPDVSRFRNLIHDKGFNKKFVSFLRDGRMRRLLDDARWLLTVEPNGSVGIRLPPVLLADIARNSPDTFFLLLRWLDRMMENQKDPRKIPLKNQKLMLGSLTSLAWFAKEPSLCLESLWPRLQDALPKSLPSYFDKGVLRPCLRPKEGKLQLIPPIVPAVLRSGITVRMWGHGLLSRHTAAAWESWDWDNSFAEKQHPQDTILPWFRNMLSRAGADGDGQLTVSDLALTAWINFSSRLLGMKELVLYAQKDWLCRWFPNFDPASLDQLEDTDRPWDLDHIHPHKYVDNIRGGGHAIRIINKWHNSIGNLRAWPFELNRGDGESPPFRKLTLSDLPDQCTITRYDVRTDSELRNASVIRTGHKDWIKSTPNFDGFNSNYLRDYPEHRPHVLRAIVNRMQDLYAIWYRDYRVGELLRP